jgi:pyridoxamine 5'-phosphate oxidase
MCLAMPQDEKTRSAETSTDFTSRDEPLDLFAEWFLEAKAGEPSDPNAMSLATVDASGMPNVRMVLLKGYDHRGFVFYTNLESAKGTELASSPKAAACFHWKSLRRQVRIRGPVTPVTEAEADDYFASRPRDSRIGAWASRQSRPLESRFALEKAVATFAAKHVRPFRLHDRILFTRPSEGAPWERARLYP